MFDQACVIESDNNTHKAATYKSQVYFFGCNEFIWMMNKLTSIFITVSYENCKKAYFTCQTIQESMSKGGPNRQGKALSLLIVFVQLSICAFLFVFSNWD